MKKRPLKTKRPTAPRRRGVVVPLVAFLLPALLVLLGFSVDAAYMQNTRAELRLATDNAARAAAAELSRSDSTTAATAVAVRIANANTVAGQPLGLRSEDVEFGRSNAGESGRYDFTPRATPFNAVRVRAQRTRGSASGPVPLFFGSFIGRQVFEPTADAVASFLNYDICLVLDRSSSMKLDLDDPTQGLSASDPRLCQPPQPTSRWCALDDAIDVFADILAASPAAEQVSLVTYASNIDTAPWLNNCGNPHRTTKEAFIDLPLTPDISELTDEVERWSNAIFNGSTHIEEGIRTGMRAVGGDGARREAEKVVIVLTDGHQNIGEARNAARDCAQQGILCHTITFSNDADRALMEEVAEIGGGSYFHANSRAELIDAFRLVAGEVTRLTD